MGISKYNSEGYADPTAFQAVSVIEGEMAEARKKVKNVVYICSPYSGDTEKNVRQARKYCRFAVDSGYIPLAPHLLFPQFMNDRNLQERDLAMHMDLVLLSKCAELWVFGQTLSAGMQLEVQKAMENGIPIRRFKEAPKEESK